MSITWSSAWKQNCCICRQWLAAVWFFFKGLKNGAYVNRPAVRVPHDCKDCTDVPFLFSLLVNITFQHLVLIFGVNSGLPHPKRTAMSAYVSCLYWYYNGVICSYTETVRDIPQSSSVHYCPGIFYLPAQKLTSPTCLSPEGLDAQSRPRPDEETKYSAERGWNPGLYRFLYRPASRTGECWCFTKPF